MVWAATLGFLIFAEIPANVLLSAGLVIAAGVAMLWRSGSRLERGKA
ncbi:MAG TPA: hypothetical protein VJY34_23840 [Roseiarcus sp.]|nr:hypothetical protein [Roseiarcus sp.]